jgi:hypothetical protein
MRMRREARHNGLARLAKVVSEAGNFGVVDPRVDKQHASPAQYDNGVALHELALVDQHTLRNLPEHGTPSACGLQPLGETVVLVVVTSCGNGPLPAELSEDRPPLWP